MQKKVVGLFEELDGQKFYKIENYDCMDDFFMTITSSSDVWNFCWSQGGISAGRVNCDNAVFPYYTADKISDMKRETGSRTFVAVQCDSKTILWEPFESLLSNSTYKTKNDKNIQRNIYKNENGTKIWFEEINKSLGLAFRYGWTSSAKYGLVKMSHIENLTENEKSICVLDGCLNILPACIDATLQKDNSILLDAYKQTDLDIDSNIAFFSLSSVLTDKAEPSECLLANVSWFSKDDGIILLGKNTIESFFENEGCIEKLSQQKVLKGERGSCFIARKLNLKKSDNWYQVFETSLTPSKIADLKNKIKNKKEALVELEKDIQTTDSLLSTYILESDGLQNTSQDMTCVHHRANVLFNIMRGGFFADNGKINVPDFLDFVLERNKEKFTVAQKILSDYKEKYSVKKEILENLIEQNGDSQLKRLLLEYLPIIFSRRHGDPSRPWNRFNIKLTDKNSNPILNYEGNWRDIFQNWEALVFSYPSYIKNICEKFLSAMTIDGFNPYRISREGIDWETPDPNNPWAQYGYWGDHQVIYLQKLLELWNNIDKEDLLNSLSEEIYSSSNVPYRLKSYKEICENPRNSILFDEELSNHLIKAAKEFGTDKKLVCSKNREPALVNLTSKLMQIIISKASNLVPGGGIWMNTQRPEWNDANNALAGYGLSVVTTCYLNRMLVFLKQLYESSSIKEFKLPLSQAKCLKELLTLFRNYDNLDCKTFVDKAGIIFETERNDFYKFGYGEQYENVSTTEIINFIKVVQSAIEKTIKTNKRNDGLYHTYNTMIIEENKITIKNLQEMLEGQVAVLSSRILSEEESLELLKNLKQSKLFEERQKSYMLYPNKELPAFLEKNNILATEVNSLKDLINRTKDFILQQDSNNVFHFNPKFKNARIMVDMIESNNSIKLSDNEKVNLLSLYEKTFRHQNFTGRSGTFYAYEGLGSIYWHMVSKLLLATQENALSAYNKNKSCAKDLENMYYEIQSGLSFKKSPELYGAFPFDPYSHTPFHKGAKQPGMTGQVKEEILTRWGELGISIENGCACFTPHLLRKEEFFNDGTLNFYWCGTKIEYKKSSVQKIDIEFSDGKTTSVEGKCIPKEISKNLFDRNGKIKTILVSVIL